VLLLTSHRPIIIANTFPHRRCQNTGHQKGIQIRLTRLETPASTLPQLGWPQM